MKVLAVCKSKTHTLSKPPCKSIHLIKGLGVEGDAHSGKTVKHRSRVRKDPTQPNLRQVHLMHAELFEELSDSGYRVGPGQMGENITTSGVDLLDLPRGCILKLGSEVEIEITGLRNPCAQLDGIQKGLMAMLVGKNEHGDIIRKAGIMAIVLKGGDIYPDDTIEVVLPDTPHHALQKV